MNNNLNNTYGININDAYDVILDDIYDDFIEFINETTFNTSEFKKNLNKEQLDSILLLCFSSFCYGALQAKVPKMFNYVKIKNNETNNKQEC